jgi:hypothetical protein
LEDKTADEDKSLRVASYVGQTADGGGAEKDELERQRELYNLQHTRDQGLYLVLLPDCQIYLGLLQGSVGVG